MKPEDIKKIRADLELTQDDLATILGVTKATVVRYESSSPKSNSTPQGDPERKLAQLQGFLSNVDDRKRLLELRRKPGGISSLAGIVAVGAAAFPVAAAAIGTLGLGAILAAPGIAALSHFLSKKIKK